MLKKIGRSGVVQRVVGEGLALWLRLIHATSRFADQPADLYGPIRDKLSLYRGDVARQHFLVPFMRPRRTPVPHSDLAPWRWRDQRGGRDPPRPRLIRGSGGKASRQFHKRGPAALREMVATLKAGLQPSCYRRRAANRRHCRLGIVTLARLSGRPIVPVAAVTSNFIQLSTWGQGGRQPAVLARSVRGRRSRACAADADSAMMEAKRLELEAALDRAAPPMPTPRSAGASTRTP